MSFKKTLWAVLAMVVTLMVGSQALWAQQDFQAENFLSEKTLLYLGVTNGKEVCEQARSLGLAKFFEDEEWQAFYKTVPPQFLDEAKRQIKKMEQMFGVTLQDLEDMCSGAMSLALVDVVAGEGSPMPQPIILLSWDFGKDKDRLAKIFERIRKQMYQMSRMPITENTEEVHGFALTTIETQQMPLALTYFGNTMLLCTDKNYLETLLATKEEIPNSLAKSKQYSQVKKQLLQGAPGAYLYLNLKDIRSLALNFAAPFLGPKAEQVQAGLQLSGLDKFDAIGVGVSFREKHVVESFYFYTPQGRTGVLGALLPSTETAKELLDHLPQNVIGFSHGSFDFALLYEKGIEILKGVYPPGYDMFLQQKNEWEARLGVKLEDLLQSLGKEYLLSFNFSQSFIPDIAFQWTLNDAKKFQENIKKLIQFVPPKYRYDVAWKERNFTYFNFSTQREPIPVAPTITVEENRVIVTLFPESLKNILTQSKGKLPDDFTKYLNGRKYSMTEYWNIKDIIVPLYRTALPLLQSLAPRHRMPVEPALLPSADVLAKYLTDYVSVAIHTSEDMLWEMHSPTGVVPVSIISGIASYQIERHNPFRKHHRMERHKNFRQPEFHNQPEETPEEGTNTPEEGNNEETTKLAPDENHGNQEHGVAPDENRETHEEETTTPDEGIEED